MGSNVAAAMASAAAVAADQTAHMARGAGRASYVEAAVAVGVADPGAVAIRHIVEGIASALATA